MPLALHSKGTQLDTILPLLFDLVARLLVLLKPTRCDSVIVPWLLMCLGAELVHQAVHNNHHTVNGHSPFTVIAAKYIGLGHCANVFVQPTISADAIDSKFPRKMIGGYSRMIYKAEICSCASLHAVMGRNTLAPRQRLMHTEILQMQPVICGATHDRTHLNNCCMCHCLCCSLYCYCNVIQWCPGAFYAHVQASNPTPGNDKEFLRTLKRTQCPCLKKSIPNTFKRELEPNSSTNANLYSGTQANGSANASWQQHSEAIKYSIESPQASDAMQNEKLLAVQKIASDSPLSISLPPPILVAVL